MSMIYGIERLSGFYQHEKTHFAIQKLFKVFYERKRMVETIYECKQLTFYDGLQNPARFLVAIIIVVALVTIITEEWKS